MRKPKEPVPTRDEQRAIILSSVHYSSGDEFNRSDIAPLVGMASENCAFLLASMASDGLLRKRLVKQGNKQFICYARPMTNLARKKWRKHSNWELNIAIANLLGACGR
jgi:hypothetical protein